MCDQLIVDRFCRFIGECHTPMFEGYRDDAPRGEFLALLRCALDVLDLDVAAVNLVAPAVPCCVARSR
jgi:hypothetical protein